MKTVTEVLSEAADLGVHCAERTFWKYLALGLLPAGEKIPGRGNVLYFPEDTTTRLVLIQFLTKQLAIPLSGLAHASWPKPFPIDHVWPGSRLTEIAPTARTKYEETKQAAMKDFVQWLLEEMRRAQSETGRGGKTLEATTRPR